MGSTENVSCDIEVKEESVDKLNSEVIEDLDWSADQEILLLYSLHGLKPVGPNKHFRMLSIQERLSNAMNKTISSKAIWKKLNMFYDLEALDEAEAEADSAVAEIIDFSLPETEYGELMTQKLKAPIKVEKFDSEYESSNFSIVEFPVHVKSEPDSESNNELENAKDTVETPRGTVGVKDGKKESTEKKRGPKKKDVTPIKDVTIKEENEKEFAKKDGRSKKESKKGTIKDGEKKEAGKKTSIELKKDTLKEEKKESATKSNKKEIAEKKVTEQSKKDSEIKKSDMKKVTETSKSQRIEATKSRSETPKQPKLESSKRTEAKTVRAETPKPQRTETPKPLRVEALKKESSGEKKKDADRKIERKSPEKTPESARVAKLRIRDKKEVEPEKPETPTGVKRERSRDSTSKTSESQSEEPPAKKVKTPLPKGRPTRNSIEPQQKPGSSAVNVNSPQKRRR